ncbi:MAG: hypothetical protein ACM3Y9_03810, partial [Ignavibacteria bacterium]
MIQRATTPVIAIASLLAACKAFAVPLEEAYLTLALLAFSLTFPARVPLPQGDRLALAVDILAYWLVVVGLLLLLGWTTRTLELFDRRVISAWIVATPFALLAAHATLPLFLGKLMAADGVRRVAVVAGGGEMAARLARDIGASPQLGIRVAGWFDDRAATRLEGGAPEGRLGGLAQLADYVRAQRVAL